MASFDRLNVTMISVASLVLIGIAGIRHCWWSPEPLGAGLALGALVGPALGASVGLGAFIQMPIPPAAV